MVAAALCKCIIIYVDKRPVGANACTFDEMTSDWTFWNAMDQEIVSGYPSKPDDFDEWPKGSFVEHTSQNSPLSVFVEESVVGATTWEHCMKSAKMALWKCVSTQPQIFGWNARTRIDQKTGAETASSAYSVGILSESIFFQLAVDDRLANEREGHAAPLFTGHPKVLVRKINSLPQYNNAAALLKKVVSEHCMLSNEPYIIATNSTVSSSGAKIINLPKRGTADDWCEAILGVNESAAKEPEPEVLQISNEIPIETQVAIVRTKRLRSEQECTSEEEREGERSPKRTCGEESEEMESEQTRKILRMCPVSDLILISRDRKDDRSIPSIYEETQWLW